MASVKRPPDHLARMGLDVWVPRVSPPFGPSLLQGDPTDGVYQISLPDDRQIAPDGVTCSGRDMPASAGENAMPVDEAALMNWPDLEQAVAACNRCPLHETRTQTVFGVGDRSARWMIVGEAPGEQEDLQGEPFVGRAGLLLNEMIQAVGFSRQAVYIANVLKCRPPRNRDPSPDEAMACESYLKAQLALVKPVIILAVGRVAAQNLLKTTTPIGKLRGEIHHYQNIPLVVTYHPAYLLRSQTEKRRAWDDLKLARRVYREHS